MQQLFLEIHSYWRWVVLVAGVGATVLSLLAATGSRPWDALADRFAFFFPLALDIQVLVGIILWLIEERWAGDAILSYLHPLAMLVAVGLAHAGRSASEKASGSVERGRKALIFFVASIMVVLVAIPLYSWPV